MKRLFALGLMLLAGGLGPAAWSQTANPGSDSLADLAGQIRLTRATLSTLREERTDLQDQRGNLMLKVLREMLQKNAEEAKAKHDPQKAAELERESADLQAYRDEVWDHGLKILEANHDLEKLKVQYLTELIDKLSTRREVATREKVMAVIREIREFTGKAQLITEEKYGIEKSLLESKQNDNFETVRYMRLKIHDLQGQLNRLMAATATRLKEIGMTNAEAVSM